MVLAFCLSCKKNFFIFYSFGLDMPKCMPDNKKAVVREQEAGWAGIWQNLAMNDRDKPKQYTLPFWKGVFSKW